MLGEPVCRGTGQGWGTSIPGPSVSPVYSPTLEKETYTLVPCRALRLAIHVHVCHCTWDLMWTPAGKEHCPHLIDEDNQGTERQIDLSKDTLLVIISVTWPRISTWVPCPQAPFFWFYIGARDAFLGLP